MTLARVLATALLLCSLSAFAQNQNSQTFLLISARNLRSEGTIVGETVANPFPLKSATTTTGSEPWTIFPNSPDTLVSGQARPDQISSDQSKLDLHLRQMLESQLDRLRDDGPTCYAIRSYMVARDAKDSDSTHPVSYSTCQPAIRYGLKTTEIHSAATDR